MRMRRQNKQKISIENYYVDGNAKSQINNGYDEENQDLVGSETDETPDPVAEDLGLGMGFISLPENQTDEEITKQANLLQNELERGEVKVVDEIGFGSKPKKQSHNDCEFRNPSHEDHLVRSTTPED